jgi:glycosyltransferase involved in cell wall biosynthesis
MSQGRDAGNRKARCEARPVVLMLLTNAYDPDPRVRQEALALSRMGCNVRILAWDRDNRSPQSECLEGITVERLHLRSRHGRGTTQLFFYAWLYLKMLWRAWQSSFDVVHCHDLDTLPVGFLLGKLRKKPVIYDSHESFADMLTGSVHPVVRHAVVLLENFLIRRIDLLITVGEKLRRHFEQRGAGPSTVVGNWKRLDEFSRAAAENLELRVTLGIPPEAMVVVCVTQLLKDRKIEELLEAVAECPGVYVIIGGRGVREAYVREQAALNARIQFVGFVHSADIPKYTCAADVVYYGFDPENPNAQFSAPNKLFEALAAGKPLITGTFGEIAEVVTRAACGVVLPEYSVETVRCALATLHNPHLRKRMGENARSFAEGTMNWRKGEEILYREYSKLLPNTLHWPGEEWNVATAPNGTVAVAGA